MIAARYAPIAARQAPLPPHHHQPPHHPHILQANPLDFTIRGMSRDSIAPEIRLLLVSQLPQIDGARLVRLQAQIGEEVRRPERVHTKSNPAGLVRHVGEEQNRLRLRVEVPGIGVRTHLSDPRAFIRWSTCWPRRARSYEWPLRIDLSLTDAANTARS